MAKDKLSKGENIRVKTHRNPNLLSHYHDCTTRVFYNGGRANENLHNLFLKAAKNGEEERIRNFLARSSKRCNVNLNYKDKNTGNTAVVLAASRNHVKIVKMLLNYGADITLLNDEGQSIFDVAPDSIIPMLLASVERQGVSNRHLLQAAWQGNLQILQRLLSSQANLDVNCKNADGMTPLLLVTRDVNLFEKIERNVAERGYNPLEVVKELLQHNADCSITASDGKTPLHFVAHNKGANSENMANFIIEDANSTLELPDKTNSLPIHLASRHDNCPVLLALINGGANVNARGHLGQTPLHVAASHGHERCSTALLSNGANVTIVDEYGNSPVDVSKSRTITRVLKEAWVEQTREYSSRLKRSYSAPTEFLTEKEKILTENTPECLLSPRVKKQTSPRKISADSIHSSSSLLDVNQSYECQVPHPPRTKSKHLNRSHSMTKGYMAPRPPKTSPNDSNRTKYKTQTRQISSYSADGGLRSNQQVLELPRLSIKNIELHLTSSFHSDLPLQSPYCNRYASIQRFRLLNNSSSLPHTPNTYYHGSTSRMSDYSASQGTDRMKLPKTLAPLSNEGRIPSSDSRQACSRGSLHSGQEFVGDVLDLDNLQSTSSCHPSLPKMFVFDSEDKDMIQPPPSPCGDSELEHPPSPCGDSRLENKTNGKDIELDNTEETCSVYKNKGKNCYHKMVGNVMDEKFEKDKASKKEDNRSLKSRETFSTCNNCLQNCDCNYDDCYKTQTFSSVNLSKFWIPCTKDGETSPGTTDDVKEKSNDEIDNSVPKKGFKKEQENSIITKKTDNKKDGNAVEDERQNIKKMKESSLSFFVDFSDIKIQDSVKRCKCGKSLDNDESNNCKDCENLIPQKKTFWISLDGETSDGETDGDSATKKCVVRNVDSSGAERFSRRALSFPEEKLSLRAMLGVASTQNGLNLDVETDEQILSGKYLTVRSTETFEVQTRSVEDSMNESADNVKKDNQDLDNSDMKVYSEDTFIIEKTAQENDEQSGSKNDCKQGLSAGNKADECNDVERDLDRNVKVDVLGDRIDDKEKQLDDRIKSSIVLQSFSMDDEDQHNEQCEEKIPSENTNPPRGDVLPSDPAKKTVEPCDNDAPVVPKTAWSGDGPLVGQPVGVQICNAFPSPVPPINVKPEVHPPIGRSCSAKTKLRKTGPVKKRKESKKKDEKNTIGKEQISSGKKGKRGKKGKGKKEKPTFKEISVNQSLCGGGYDDVPTSGPVDFQEGMLSPDLDKVPTLSMDPRANTKLLRGKFPTLSPIPESPRSVILTPRTEEIEKHSFKNAAVENFTPVEKSSEHEEPVKPMENEAEITIEAEKVVTEDDNGDDDDDDDDDDCGIIKDAGQDAENVFSDEGVDEVDGGMFSRLFNMCMPRLKVISPDSDSEVQSSDNDDKDDDDADENHSNDDHGFINKTVKDEQLRFPVDEADQDMENMMQNIIENDVHEHADKQSSLDQENFMSTSSHNSNALKNKELKATWTMSYVNQMSDISPWDFDSPDDVFIHHEHAEERFASPQEEEMTSDNDSSYISCESTSRAVSECSTTESNDSFFSSQDSFHGMPSRDDTSVEINFHEQIHKPQTSITSSSGSSDSQLTLRPRSSSISSEFSVQSFFPSNSRFVRNQVSSGSGSLSSATSCGEEIQWQKGSILGKGGFGTVWLGLVNTGEMIAVKQVELNNKDESEAEKQYEKLQEEVSLLKSLRHHNIVKYIGTCLDDNSIVNIFMEFVPGGSIAQALKRFGAFVEPVFQRYTKQILSGAEYLHRKNVIHRDIKGGNIMLMPNGVIKLIDFGCAKRLCMNLSLSKSSILHSMKGTPYWMAPEVIKETSGQGTKSDIWSIGCTVYEMATGNPPWSHMAPMPAMFAIGNGSAVPQLSNSFSQAAREFIAACMTREPSARPSASDLLQHEFITGLI